MILTVVLFSNQASALDFDEWVGFECFEYDFRKGKLNTNIKAHPEIPCLFSVEMAHK